MKRVLGVFAIALICFTIFLSYKANYAILYKDTSIKSQAASRDTKIEKKGKAEELTASENLSEQGLQELDYDEVKMAVVGDVLVHDTQLQSQYDQSTGQYDFKNNFKYVKGYIENADIAVANFETVLAGANKRYTGFPVFNSPDAIADALRDTGFDVLTTANNHILDYGFEGMLRTNVTLKEKGFKVLGTKENAKDKGYFIVEKNNIKIGMANYVFETQKVGSKKTINSIVVPSSAEKLLDTFNYSSFDKNLEGMKERVEELRASGADFIVVFMHWGEEYSTKPNAYQQSIAQKLSDIGVDVIIGGHPHVLQKLDIIKGKNGNKTFVAYSTGNFLSNQCYERLEKREPEDGMILNLSFRKDKTNNKATLGEVSYIPTWVHRIPKGDLYTYEILPLPEALEEKEKYKLLEGDSEWRAINSMKQTDSVMSSLVSSTKDIAVFKYDKKKTSKN